MTWILITSVIFIIVGIAMTWAAGRQLKKQKAFMRSSAVASGTVVALSEVRDREEISYFPKVEFQTAAGRKIVFQSQMGTRDNPKGIGDSVSVRYRIDQPQKAEIDTFFALWGLTLIFGLLGGTFLIVGLGILSGVVAV